MHTLSTRLHIAIGLMNSHVRAGKALIGNWKIKEKHVVVIECSCGKKYLQTKVTQVVCIWCENGKVRGADLRINLKYDE